ncbi:MAG: DMT family transporter [Lachnospiraceae bacterium]|nr:DMT family transporter [Lachnospiraceae bacterium]
MLNKLSPFFAILLSIPLLKEKPSKFDIFATITAFVGAMFIIRPTGSNMTLVPALAGLYGGLGAGTAYVFVRRATGKGERTPIIVICFSLFSCLFSLPWLILDYVPMSREQWLMLIMAGASAALGQFSITSAYRFAPAKNISVFDYTQVIFATIWGVIFFNELPTVYSIIGYVIIIGVAVVRWRRDVTMAKA